MKTLHNYLTRQVLGTLLMTVTVCTFVLLLGSVIKEVLSLLVNRQATLGVVTQAIGLLIPFVLVFALPMGLLTATLLVFGRLSADQELTAIRAGGVSLVALITPVLLLSVVLSGVCAFVNMEFAPRCRVAYKRILLDMGMAHASTFLQEKTFIKDFKNRIIYIDRIEDGKLKDVLVYFLKDDKVESYLRAAECIYQVDPQTRKVSVILRQGWRVGLMDGRSTPMWGDEFEPAEIPLDSPQPTKTKISDMTWSELWRELRDVERQLSESVVPAGASKETLAARQRQLSEATEDATQPIKVQIHKRAAFSFACIAFTLVGIPLGVRAHRRETTAGIALGLGLVILYYTFIIFAESFDTRPEYASHLIVWLPNFLFQTVGGVLLWRANRGI